MTSQLINATLPVEETRPARTRKIFALGLVRYKPGKESDTLHGGPQDQLNVLGLMIVEDEVEANHSKLEIE